MQARSAHDSSGLLPPALLGATPRRVRASALGVALLVTTALLVIAGVWGGIELHRRAQVAERHVGLFELERIVTAGEVVRVQRRGGDDDYRVTIGYSYVARGRELAGATTLHRPDRDRYAIGSQVAVWYLASEPQASWLDGYAPEPRPGWPATAVQLACGAAALTLILSVRRQWNLLAYGRPAVGTVTKIEKKRSDKGTSWRVDYEWPLLSGAMRTGHYRHSRTQPPAVGDPIVIVYARDTPSRHSRYPLSLVSLCP